jgi:D-serine deaminase-like pyridoxal phosphate-dependent protein
MSDGKYRTQTRMNALVDDPVIHPLGKGLGYLAGATPARQVPTLGWNLLREDLSLPAAVLYEDRLRHNLRWMQEFASAYHVKLAPHGKTTMAPRLFQRQLDAGAWGITLATATQVRVAYEHGIRRVLMANQLLGPKNVEIVARMLEDSEFEFFCLVDSVELAEHLGRTLPKNGRRLNVLLELGVEGGRTGVRNRNALDTVLSALERQRTRIALCGVEVYEGVLQEESSIRSFLSNAVEVTAQLARAKRFERAPAILSGAGSAWYDVVAEVFAKAEFAQPVEIVLRPGCYLTHDVGVYREAQQRIKLRNPVAHRMESSLLPALQLWAYVQSIPEPRKAILGLGKRDAAFDAGLPTPALHFRAGNLKPMPTPEGWVLTKMMDQHAYMQIAEGSDLRVGDMIGLDISHPCLTFDKWHFVCLVDSDYNVIEIVETFF